MYWRRVDLAPRDLALLAGKYVGAIWMDPSMGVIGAVLVARWSMGLMTSTSAVLLDRQAHDGCRI